LWWTDGPAVADVDGPPTDGATEGAAGAGGAAGAERWASERRADDDGCGRIRESDRRSWAQGGAADRWWPSQGGRGR
jgi:hypothetical protein